MPLAAQDTTKHRILNSAVTLFSQKGYAGVSMRHIAQAVGVSPPALYNHFASKEALYRSAVSAAFEDKAGRLLAVLESSEPPLDKLQQFIFAMTLEVQNAPDFRCLLQRELMDADSERLTFLAEFIFNKLQQPFIQLLQQLRPECDAFLLSEIIFGMIKQHYEMSRLHPYIDAAQPCERRPEDVANQVIQIIFFYFSGAKRCIPLNDY